MSYTSKNALNERYHRSTAVHLPAPEPSVAASINATEADAERSCHENSDRSSHDNSESSARDAQPPPVAVPRRLEDDPVRLFVCVSAFGCFECFLFCSFVLFCFVFFHVYMCVFMFVAKFQSQSRV